jgi:hypothetical protein
VSDALIVDARTSDSAAASWAFDEATAFCAARRSRSATAPALNSSSDCWRFHSAVDSSARADVARASALRRALSCSLDSYCASSSP